MALGSLHPKTTSSTPLCEITNELIITGLGRRTSAPMIFQRPPNSRRFLALVPPTIRLIATTHHSRSLCAVQALVLATKYVSRSIACGRGHRAARQTIASMTLRQRRTSLRKCSHGAQTTMVSWAWEIATSPMEQFRCITYRNSAHTTSPFAF